ncbi:MAG: hypothetical protein JXB40_05060 [Candidatus Omnitrophica bacterium]|nr:hypothetical protein [Candidatus Omnitrophota bacterium]
MGISRCWQESVVNGFGRSKTRKTVAERKKAKRMLVRKMVKELKAAGKHVDLQAINEEAVFKLGRKR